MILDFYKYQGTGNDFILVDNRAKTFQKSNIKFIQKLCDRNFGIGADGLILIENDDIVDFKMIYFNADGKESTMCGNGGRCIVAFAKKLNLITDKTLFNAIDGLHKATIKDNIVSLQMIDVDNINVSNEYIFLDTGSPHHVQIVKNINDFNVFTEGRRVRNEIYGEEGSNINFVEKINDPIFKVRTYERGVEDETLACGTGVTAVAIAMHKTNQTKENKVTLLVEGGQLEVSFSVENQKYTNVFLTGKAQFVFKGTIEI